MSKLKATILNDSEDRYMLVIDINRSEKWVAFAVTGVLSIPPIGLGLGPDMYLIQDQKDSSSGTSQLFSAVEDSFQQFGVTDHIPLTLGNTKVILIPMKDITDYGIKVGLMVADLALSIFNKKVESSTTTSLFPSSPLVAVDSFMDKERSISAIIFSKSKIKIISS